MIKAKILLLFLIFFSAFLLGTRVVSGQFIIQPHPYCTNPSLPACWSTRTVNQRMCGTCSQTQWVCAGSIPGGQPYDLCQYTDVHGNIIVDPTMCVGNGPCREFCVTWQGSSCNVFDENVVCNTAGDRCEWVGKIYECDGQYPCTESDTDVTLGCCGPGSITNTPTPGGGGTATPTPTPTTAPATCSVSFSPDPITVAAGSTANVAATVTFSGGTVDRVDFAIASPAIATINPITDNASPYQTVVTGVSPGDTELRATVYMNGVATCGFGTAVDPTGDPVTVTNAGAWWQVIDADVITNGDLFSPIPATCTFPPVCDPAFSVTKIGGMPGIPTFAGNYDFNSGVGLGTVSGTGWLARANYQAQTPYNYAFFERQVPGDTNRNPIGAFSIVSGYLTGNGLASPDGYFWFFRNDDLTLTGEPAIGSKKIVLFVNGNLTIDGRINITPGAGFFMAIASGNILINPGITNGANPELEGVFVTDQNFQTVADSIRLKVRGMVAAYGRVVLGRNLPDNSTLPAESFEYAPDLLFKIPQSLQLKRTRWKEVSP